MLFEDLIFFVEGVVRVISHYVSDFFEEDMSRISLKRSSKTIKVPRLFPQVQMNISVGFFDGAEQRGRCGVGCTIILDRGNYFELCMGCGIGPNTRAELLSSWGLLKLAILKEQK